MKILFIGGTGNLSSDCAALLHERGHEIFITTRGNSVVPADYTAVRTDRKDLPAMRAALTGLQFDVVVNFLGYEVPELAIDYEIFNDRIDQYIFISSTTVYVKPPRHLPITESEPRGNPFWEYAQKKHACEDWLLARPEFPVTIVRPSHTYSKRWTPNTVSSAGYTIAARFEAGQPVFVPDDGSIRGR